jgi:hypothetical protein
MEKTIRLFLVFCLVPFILLLVQVGLSFVPVYQISTYDGQTIYIHFGNWVTDSGLDFWLIHIWVSAIIVQGVFASALLIRSWREKKDVALR